MAQYGASKALLELNLYAYSTSVISTLLLRFLFFNVHTVV